MTTKNTQIHVHKFGGKSICSVQAIMHVGNIIQSFIQKDAKYIFVFSAIENVTRILLAAHEAYWSDNNHKIKENLARFSEIHTNIILGLFESDDHPAMVNFNKLEEDLRKLLSEKRPKNPSQLEIDQHYAKVLAYGELASSHIMNAYLHHRAIHCHLCDARRIIKTNAEYRSAKVLLAESNMRVENQLLPIFQNVDCIVTQGFIGMCLKTGETTTLGFDGSDYTASALAHLIIAQSVTFWKDVLGVYTEKPRKNIPNEIISELSYDGYEFGGFTVVRSDAIALLKHHQIPVYVRSYMDYSYMGTRIGT